MGKFPRGTIVIHKAMGKGVAINEVKDGMIEVRMQNGQKETFYPEELETVEEYTGRLNNPITSDQKNWRIGE